MRKRLASRGSKPQLNDTKKLNPYAKLVRMSLLLGIMCVFVACSAPSSAPINPNLVLTVAPGAASVEIDGLSAATVLSQEEASLQSSGATVTSYLLQPGSYYTVNVKAQGRADFSKKYWLRDGRKLNLKVGLARKGGKLPEGGYAEAFEAEDAKVSSSLEVADGDSKASSGSYLTQPSTISNTESPRQDAHVNFFAPEDGNYTLWARMFANSSDDDAYYIGFNGDYGRTYPEKKGEYVWVEVAKANLKAGGNRISIGHAEAGARLDLLFVTNKILSSTELNEFITFVEEEETDIGTPTPEPTPAPATPGSMSLRGNPNFSVSSLNPEQRKWYDRIWKAINNPEQDATELAKSDDLFKYRGLLYGYDNALLTAFRVTGDLRLLDEVSRISQIMRGELADSWRDTADGTDGTKDGYLNWVNRYDTSKQFKGKDTILIYELKTHTHVAQFAWAFENNRDLQSPGGYDYSEQADFWKDYLVNHFEAKWRKRNAKPTGFPFAQHIGFHSMHSFMTWHYYMGKLTGSTAYTKEAERMAQSFWKNDFKETSSRYGEALVWSRVVFPATDENYLMPQHYARYIVREAVDMHLEGFQRYADRASLEKIARSVADFVVIDASIPSFARDIGGGKSRAGIPASSTSWGNMTPYRFADSGWSLITAWDKDSNSTVAKASESAYKLVSGEAYGKDPKRVSIPVGMLLKESLN